MALIPRLPIVFALSSFEYRPIHPENENAPFRK